jgi:hypothetical protein
MSTHAEATVSSEVRESQCARCETSLSDLSSEREPQIRQDCNFQKKKISGQKSQIGLDTKTYWLTDRQLQSNSDSDSDYVHASKFTDQRSLRFSQSLLARISEPLISRVAVW